MDIRRVILCAALALVVYSLWLNWQTDYPALPAQKVTSSHASIEGILPVEHTETAEIKNTVPVLSENTAKKSVTVKTDVLDVVIDLQQGDITGAKLLTYPISASEKNKPFILLQDNSGMQYVANSSLFTVHNQTIETQQFDFTTAQPNYRLVPGNNQLVVTLEGKNADDLYVQKIFVFTQGSYLITVRYHILNKGSRVWHGYMNSQLTRHSPPEDKSSMFQIGSYTGASYSNPGQHRYQKVSFKDMAKANLDLESQGGWIAMQQHYFLSAWIPAQEHKNHFYTRLVDENYSIGMVRPLTVQPAQTGEIEASLYVGPEVTSQLKAIAPGLDLTVDYGWLWFLSSLLFSFMKTIHNFVGNWGWSIVLVTVFIKLAFFRLSATSYKSMAGMRKLQPKLQLLRERYGDDKAKISQATMELYRQEKVNPLGGCLPIVIQIPVFIALYWVLLASVELRQAPFMLWIHDLAAADPYHVLPIIMGATMLIQQKLNPAPPDPLQAKIMLFLPILFTGLFWSFPAGLVLYWIVNNTLSIMQQWYITRKYNDDKILTPRITVKK